MKFSLEDMQGTYYDFSNYEDCIKERQKAIKNVSVLDNIVRVETESEANEMICVAVPYSKGWSAKIDGNSVKVYKMNDMYMGMEVPAGEHLIELNYFTTGLKGGIMISMISLLGIIVLCSKRTGLKGVFNSCLDMLKNK